MIHHTSCQDTGRIQNTDHQQPELLVMATEHCGLGIHNSLSSSTWSASARNYFPVLCG